VGRTLLSEAVEVALAFEFDLRRQPKIKAKGNVNGVGQECPTTPECPTHTL